MYERNAIVLERYFAKLFGYDEKSNIKNNYTNYSELVAKLDKYQEATKEEDKIIAEYDEIINKIQNIQKNQDSLYKKNTKLLESRKDIFENIDENVDTLKKKLEKIEEETKNNNEEMRLNGENFIVELSEFNDKSVNRNQCSRNRRIVESEYQKKLKETVTNLNNINSEKVNEIKNFFKSENNIHEEIQNKIMKNGEKEKIPFDLNVIQKATDIQTEIEEKQTEILCSVYDKTNRLLVEIKNDAIKLDKHKKLIKDSDSKLNFLNAMKEYLTLFLDNERLNIVGGEKEHKKLMNAACENLEEDFVQIKNLYSLLTKEISGKATKKMYKELYHPEYLYDLEEQEKEFESNISRLNVIGTVIYPDYWRIEGMQKIFETFKDSIQNVYQKDLSEYEPVTVYEDKSENEDEEDVDEYDIDFDDIDIEDKETEIESKEDDEEDIKEEQDKEIDEILRFYNFDKDIIEDSYEDSEDEEEADFEEDIEIEDDDFEDEEEIEDEDYEYGFDDEDDGYDDIDFDEDDEEDIDEEDISFKGNKK